MMNTENSNPSTGQYDHRGIPVYDGDLIRVKHYHHRRRRELMWVYMIVGIKDGVPVVYNWRRHPKNETHQTLLSCIGECEIVSETGLHYTESGALMTFNERPRKKLVVEDQR